MLDQAPTCASQDSDHVDATDTPPRTLFSVGTKVRYLQDWPEGIYGIVVGHIYGDNLIKFPGWENTARQVSGSLLRPANRRELSWKPALPQSPEPAPKIIGRVLEVMLYRYYSQNPVELERLDGREKRSIPMRIHCADGFSFTIAGCRGHEKAAPDDFYYAQLAVEEFSAPDPFAALHQPTTPKSEVNRLIHNHGGLAPSLIAEFGLDSYLQSELARPPAITGTLFCPYTREFQVHPLHTTRRSTAKRPKKYACISAEKMVRHFEKITDGRLELRWDSKNWFVLEARGAGRSAPQWLLECIQDNALGVMNHIASIRGEFWTFDLTTSSWVFVPSLVSPLDRQIKAAIANYTADDASFFRLARLHQKLKKWIAQLGPAPFGIDWPRQRVEVQLSELRHRALATRVSSVRGFRAKLLFVQQTGGGRWAVERTKRDLDGILRAASSQKQPDLAMSLRHAA